MADGTTKSDRCVGPDVTRHVMVSSGHVTNIVQRDDDGNSSGGGSAVAVSSELLQRTDSSGGGGPILVSLPTSVVPGRKKTSSFQITSVTFGSRLSNDGGDDSADDLDESHTDELSSDLLDVSKTTDYDYSSEDAFSSIKDDCTSAHQQSSVILQRSPCPQSSSSSPFSVPASNVTPNNTTTLTTTTTTAATSSSGATPANVSVTVMEAANVPVSVVQNPDIHWQNRFRVVKIDTSEPFRRGRWLCLDFTDPPPASSVSSETCDRESGTGSGNSSSTSSVQHGDSLVLDASGAHNVVTTSWSQDPNVAVMGGGMTAIMDHTPNLGVVGMTVGQGEQPVLPVSIILQTQQQGNLDFTNTVLHMQGRAMQLHHPGGAPPSVVSMSQMAAGVCSVPQPSTGSGVPVSEFCSQTPQQPQSQSSEYSPHPSTTSLSHTSVPPGTVVVPPPSQPGSDYRPSAVPTAVQQQSQQSAQQVQSGLVTTTMQTQSPQELQSTSASQQQHLSLPPPSSTSSQDFVTSVSPGLQPQVYQASPATDYAHSQVTTAAGATAAAAVVATGVQQPPPLQSCQQISGTQVDQQVFVPPQQLATAPGASSSSGSSPLVIPETVTIQTVAVDGSTTLAGQQQVPQPSTVSTSSSSSSTAPPVAAVVPPVTQDGSAAPTTEEGDPDGLDELEACLREGQKPGLLYCPLTAAVSSISSYSSSVAARKYSASGASTVAIDNKIEQAMDLVKSHLMFAVREEVDVLKEKITELTDRINQLEYENSVLKANATPETLAKLSRTSASSSST